MDFRRTDGEFPWFLMGEREKREETSPITHFSLLLRSPAAAPFVIGLHSLFLEQIKRLRGWCLFFRVFLYLNTRVYMHVKVLFA